MNRWRSAALAVALVSVQTGCGAGPTSPTLPPQVVNSPPTPTPPPVPPAPAPTSSAVAVSGHIVDNVYRRLADVRVEVVEGSGLGAATTTNASGDYALPGMFSGSIAIRASKAGYVTQTMTFQLYPRESGRFDAGVTLDTPSQNLAGDYTLAIVADPTCSELPPESRIRTYEAAVTPSASVPNAYNVELSGANFSPSLNRVFATVSGDSVRFTIDPYADMVVAEQLTPSTVLTLWGDSTVGRVGPSISVSVDGELDFCPDALGRQATFPYVRCRITPVQCVSARHSLTLARR